MYYIPVHFYVYTIFIHQSSEILEILKLHVSLLEDATISLHWGKNMPSDLTYILQQKLVSNGTSSHLCRNKKEKHPNQRSNFLGFRVSFFWGEVYKSTWCFEIILLCQISWPGNQQNVTRVFLSLEYRNLKKKTIAAAWHFSISIVGKSKANSKKGTNLHPLLSQLVHQFYRIAVSNPQPPVFSGDLSVDCDWCCK